jgi:hypothetical protein
MNWIWRFRMIIQMLNIFEDISTFGKQEFHRNDFSHCQKDIASVQTHPSPSLPLSPSAAKSLLPKSVRRNSCFPYIYESFVKHELKGVLKYIVVKNCTHYHITDRDRHCHGNIRNRVGYTSVARVYYETLLN